MSSNRLSASDGGGRGSSNRLQTKLTSFRNVIPKPSRSLRLIYSSQTAAIGGQAAATGRSGTGVKAKELRELSIIRREANKSHRSSFVHPSIPTVLQSIFRSASPQQPPSSLWFTPTSLYADYVRPPSANSTHFT